MKAITALLACCIVLAGCGGKDKDDAPTSSSSSSSTGPAGNGTIEVLLNRTTPNGAVPLDVNFTLDAVFRSAAGAILPTPQDAGWDVVIANLTSGNATHDDTFANAIPSGTDFPANVSYVLQAPGTFSFEARVHAAGFEGGVANVTILANASAVGGAVLFFEGGEADESQWTLSTNVLLTNFNLVGEGPSEIEVPQEHPDGPWEITDAGARTGTHAWSHPYPDNYRTRMASVPFTVPAGGATLSYWIKGGVEGTTVEGLFVLAGPADALVDLAHHSGAFADWTEGTASLAQFAGQEIVLQFRIDSDLSCSNDSPPGGDPSGMVCGAGFDGGGLLLDDITVA